MANLHYNIKTNMAVIVNMVYWFVSANSVCNHIRDKTNRTPGGQPRSLGGGGGGRRVVPLSGRVILLSLL